MDKNKTDALMAQMNEFLGDEPETAPVVPKSSPLNGILNEVLESHGIKVRAYDPVTGEDIEPLESE